MSEPASLNDENPVAKAYRVWASTCPFTSRSTIITIVGSFVFSFFVPKLNFALGNNVRYTVYGLEVWRLVTPILCSSGFLSVIFAIMSFNQVGPQLERSLGSSSLMALMLTLTICTNVAFNALCILLVILGKEEAIYWSASGIWNLMIALIAVECMATPNVPRRFFIFPCDIPSRFYPLVLAVLFGFMRGGWGDLLCAAAVGYAYADGRLDRLKPSRSRLTAWESGCLANFVNRSGYIVSGAAMGSDAFATPLNNPQDHPSNQRGDTGSGGGLGGLFGRGGGAGGGGGGGQDGGNAGRDSGFGSNNVIKRGSTAGRDSSFAGSGQTLGGSAGGGGGTRLSGRSQTQHDPETARLARLAALEGRGSASTRAGQEDAESATPLLEPSSRSVQRLQDMGFTSSEAREALQHANGDVEAAVAYLSA